MIDKAIERYKVAIMLRPIFVEAHDYLARAYLAKGDKEGTLHGYEIVRRLDQKPSSCLWAAIQRNDPDYHDMPWGPTNSRLTAPAPASASASALPR